MRTLVSIQKPRQLRLGPAAWIQLIVFITFTAGILYLISVATNGFRTWREVGTGLILFAVVLGYLWWRFLRDLKVQEELLRDGELARGRVLPIRWWQWLRRRATRIEVEFLDSTGRRVRRKLWDYTRKLSSGSLVAVAYDPGNPEKCAVVEISLFDIVVKN